MKLSILTTILALSVSALAAVQPQKSVIVSYEASTPDSFIESAKEAIVSAGGKITHTYSLIKYVYSTAHLTDLLYCFYQECKLISMHLKGDLQPSHQQRSWIRSLCREPSMKSTSRMIWR